MQTRNIPYKSPDGKELIGFLARPDKPSGAAVLICHAGPGLDEIERSFARRLAECGYVAFVCDYHGGGKPLGANMMEVLAPLLADPSLIRPTIKAGYDVLCGVDGVDKNRIAVTGYCFGGAAAFELGCSGADVKAIIGFHSSLPTNHPADVKNIKGTVLMLQGAADAMLTAETRNAFEAMMEKSGVDWAMNVYGGALHAFTNPEADKLGFPGVAYQKTADERSWRAMLDLLEEKLGNPAA
ncbi:MAG: dienelactone hydrolase family protein [Caulobacterales bacterium]